jgi:hypothetical protein
VEYDEKGDGRKARLAILVDDGSGEPCAPPGTSTWTLSEPDPAPGEASAAEGDGPSAEEDGDQGVKLGNGRLAAWISLGALEHGAWYAGAATSVILGRIEMLDAFRSIVGDVEHDPEKRCLQIDRLRLTSPPWSAAEYHDVELWNGRYAVAQHAAGPARATVTLHSDRFVVPYDDPVTLAHAEMPYRLRRTITLWKGADFILEELSVRPAADAGDDESPVLYFSARYFAQMDMGLNPAIVYRSEIPDWLAIGCPGTPAYPDHWYQGYGFATTAHSSPVSFPHTGYPVLESAHRSFSWETGRAREATCLHLFTYGPPGDLEDLTGRAWYAHIYQPLWATAGATRSRHAEA